MSDLGHEEIYVIKLVIYTVIAVAVLIAVFIILRREKPLLLPVRPANVRA